MGTCQEVWTLHPDQTEDFTASIDKEIFIVLDTDIVL